MKTHTVSILQFGPDVRGLGIQMLFNELEYAVAGMPGLLPYLMTDCGCSSPQINTVANIYQAS